MRQSPKAIDAHGHRSLAQSRPSFGDERVNSFRQSPSPRTAWEAHDEYDEPRTEPRRKISCVYKRKGWREASRRAHTEDVREPQYFDFNQPLAYYATLGHGRGVYSAMGPLETTEKRSHHVPLPIEDPPVVDTYRGYAEAYGETTPYYRSIARAHESGLRPPVGSDRPSRSSPRPADIAAELQRSTRSRLASPNRWAHDVGRFSTARGARRGGSLVLSDEPLDHDDSGDDRDCTLTELPPHPAEEAAQAETRVERDVTTFAVPWPFHPAMDVALSLLLQRGVSIYDHENIIEYHMHPRFLADMAFAKSGSTLVKYPRRSGAAHERHLSIRLMNVDGGDAAMLVWRQHAAATGMIDCIPLAHLVGVTTAASHSSAFTRFVADPQSRSEMMRAARRLAKPRDSYSNPAGMHTQLDSDMVAAAPEGTMIVGPTVEDARKQLIPRKQCFSLWFVNPATKEARTVDLAAYHAATAVRWVDVMSGVVAVNSVTIMPDDHGTDVTRHSSMSANRRDLSNVSRTDTLMAYAFSRLEESDATQ
jgi:hypothetical protein